jgi:hypothetical protein
MVLRGIRHESDVLVRQLDGRLATLRAVPSPSLTELELAERVVDNLRRLITETAWASAADRARVRAAVHYFLGLRNTRDRRPRRSLADEITVVNAIVRDMGRADLVVA